MAAELLEQILPHLHTAIYPFRQTIPDWRMKEGNVERGESTVLNDKSWTPIRLPFEWGKSGTVHWFRTRIPVSEELVGRPVVLLVSFENALLYLDGKPFHGVSRREREVLLTQKAHARQSFLLAVQAAHGRSQHTQTFESAEIAVLNPVARGLYRGLSVLHELDKLFDHGTQESRDIRELIRRTLIYLKYFKPDGEEYPNAIARAYDYLLKAVDAEFKTSFTGLISLIGHDQVDVGWTEGDAATAREGGRAFSTVLRTMEELPEYRFSGSQPYLYSLVERTYPDLFRQIKQRVAEGRWELVGASWVESDCTMPSGESLVRQLLYGKRYMQQVFGVDSSIAWFPSNGTFSAALPQILQRSGIHSLFTVSERRNEHAVPLPPLFKWQGIDGSSVLVHQSALGARARIVPQDLRTHVPLFEASEDGASIQGMVQLFGCGSDAGPSTVEQVENYRVLRTMTGLVPSQLATAAEFFRALEAAGPELQKHEGDLRGDIHGGTFASGASIKARNRELERLLFTAELCSVLSSIFGKQKSFRRYSLAQLESAWKKTLVNQAPNILGGTAPREVMAGAEARHESAAETCRDVLKQSLKILAPHNASHHKDQSFAVFNPSAWTRTAYVELNCKTTERFLLVTDDNGEEVDHQVLESGRGSVRLLCLLRNIPAFSFRGLTVRRGASTPFNEPDVKQPVRVIETPVYRVRIDNKGFFSSIYHKRLRRDLVPKGKRVNLFQTFEDLPAGWDAREYPRDFERHRIDIFSLKSVRIVHTGHLRTTVRCEYRSPSGSLLSQDIHFPHATDLIEFRTSVRWKEKHVLLKVAMTLNVKTTAASFETPFGATRRSTKQRDAQHLQSKSDVPGLHWADLSESRFGISILNDSKYGWDFAEGVLRLTLLRAPSYPQPQDPYKADDGPLMDQGDHRFSYALYPHQGDWKKGLTVRRSHEFTHPVLVLEGVSSPTIPTLCEASKPNILVDAIKKAEDAEEVVVRLHEAHGDTTDTTIRFSPTVKRLTECDLIEREIKPLRCSGNKLSVRFKPFEIKTFKVQFRLAGKQ